MTVNFAFDTLNAKKMTASEIASSFVVPSMFSDISGLDHCYIVGPRGSGKTTLLRMLQGESLRAWTDPDAEHFRDLITYSTVFVPADELWASQSTVQGARAAFTVQMLYSFLSEILYRTGDRGQGGCPIHHPVSWSRDDEAVFVKSCSLAWNIPLRAHTIIELQSALDLILLQLGRGQMTPPLLSSPGAIGLLRFGINEFNRRVGQPQHRWALLLDEMELAPLEIHEEVQRFVRGGAGNIILKVSMSPFDRYVTTYGTSGPVSGNDYRAVFLSGQSRTAIQRLTDGLWREALRNAGYRPVSMRTAFGSTLSEPPSLGREGVDRDVVKILKETQKIDAGFASWLESRSINLDRLDELSYYQRSATIRKVYPLIVFRNAILTYRDGRPVRRSRKKSIEPFTGSSAISSILEGNPRWIKSAFSEMMRFYDPHSEYVSRGFQYDALVGVSDRFDSLLHVLPRTSDLKPTVNVPVLINALASYFNARSLGTFKADPQLCFTIDNRVSPAVIEALVLALYAGAVVHVRDRKSQSSISDFRGQRFRLTYLLATRDGREFPLRLGKDVNLSSVISGVNLAGSGVHSFLTGTGKEQMEFDYDVESD